jgi:hypothetical protein
VSNYTAITTNGTYKLIGTSTLLTTARLYSRSTDDLGGGTLTISISGLNTTDTKHIIDTMLAGEQFEYPVGADIQVFAILAGATSPDIEMFSALAP